jgi:NADPH-dependent 2,4-dienoyl-CoA reductase/sulfur reductase-like enzyme
LVFSALAARAGADAAAGGGSPARWSIRALTGVGRDDGAPVAVAPTEAAEAGSLLTIPGTLTGRRDKAVIATGGAAALVAAAEERKWRWRSWSHPTAHPYIAELLMAADGNTYDRSSIEAWLKTGKKTSPMTGAPLSHLGLAPNNLVRSMVSKYLETARA